MVMMNNQYKWMQYVGLEVLTLDGWATRGSSSFAPTIGMAHWIAGRRNAAKGTRPGLALVRDGHGSLPGPLCNNYFGRRGEVVLVAAGRANHAGYGHWKGVTGNTGPMGTEAEAADNSDWTAEQKKYYVLVKIAELFCMWEKGLISWGQITSNRIVGHSEYALPKGRKQDINGFTMNQMRAQAAALIPGFKKRVNKKAIKVGAPPVFDRVAWKFVDGQAAPKPVEVRPGNASSKPKNVRTDAWLKQQLPRITSGTSKNSVGHLVGLYQRQQLAPYRLVHDQHWGNVTDQHYRWVHALQVELNKWKGTKIPITKTFDRATFNRVKEWQRRNMGGAYKGTIADGVAGPLTTGPLGIRKYPN